MRIAVVGTGGVGGYFGARLQAGGADVSYIARGEHLAAMKKDGLRIESALGDLHLPKVAATADPADIGPVDVVMFCVKLYDAKSAAAMLKPLLKAGTAVISFQNGIEAEDLLIEAVGREHAASGIAYISSGIARPGVIGHFNKTAKLCYGEIGAPPSDRMRAFHEICQKGGFATELSTDMQKTVWEKFIGLASYAALTGLTRMGFGAILADDDSRQLLQDAMTEVANVAIAKGVNVDPNIVERDMGFVRAMPGNMKASLARDLEAGRRIEIEGLSGAVVRLGRQLGVPTPIHRVAYAALKLHANGKQDGGKQDGGKQDGRSPAT